MYRLRLRPLNTYTLVTYKLHKQIGNLFGNLFGNLKFQANRSLVRVNNSELLSGNSSTCNLPRNKISIPSCLKGHVIMLKERLHIGNYDEM